MNAEIAGIGWITADSAGCAKDHDFFSMSDGALPTITSQTLFKEVYSPFRRMDNYSKLGLGAIAFALKDAGLDKWTEKRNIGIIASTIYGCLSTDMDYFDTVMTDHGASASPALFSYTLSSTFLGEAAICFGLTGTTFIINEEHPLGLESLKLALACIARGETDKILCGVCNHYRPKGFEEIRKVPVGALFFVVEAIPANRPSYGNVELNENGRVTLNKEAVKDFSELARRCLAGS